MGFVTNLLFAVLAAVPLVLAAPFTPYLNTTSIANGTASSIISARSETNIPANTTASSNITARGNTATHANTISGANITFPANTTKSLGFFDSLFDVDDGMVNFFSRSDCQNPCIDEMYCDGGNNNIKGDLDSIQWNTAQGNSCWDLPEDTMSVGLVVSNKKGYVGITKSCEDWTRLIEGGEWEDSGFSEQEVAWGKGGGIEDQECTAGDWLHGVRAIVYNAGN